VRSRSNRPDRGPAALALFAAASLAGGCTCGHGEIPPAEATPSARADEEPEPTLAGQEGDDAPDQTAGTPPPDGVAGIALLAEVDRELSRMKVSTYSHHTHVDEASGTFEYDCSGFLGYALSRAVPDALAAVQATTARRPRSVEYVAFLEGIPEGGRKGRWQRLGRVQELAPGDVVVWLKTADSRSTNTGHTMIVHGAPSADPACPGAFVVPVADSTERPHVPGDPRADAHQTGLGHGEIVLLTDGAGAPVGYRWSRGKRSREKVTTIALGRLR
jgi:hypothetical protein